MIFKDVMRMKCKFCGAEVPNKVSKCPYCQNLLREEEESPNNFDVESIIDIAKKAVVKVVATINSECCSYGSGCLLSNGYICTNAHVIMDDSRKVVSPTIKIQFFPEISKLFYPVKVVALSVEDDVAILLPTVKIPSIDGLQLADSNLVKMGDHVFTIGNPEQQDFSYNEGVVSNPKRVHNQKLDPVIQTNISLNHGNSGGPLIDCKAKVIGMTTYSLIEKVPTDIKNINSYVSLNGMGFCISSNTISKILKKIK